MTAAAPSASLNALDQYLKELQPLPGDVRKNMMEIRQLDGQCQVKLNEAHTKANHLINSWKSMSKENKKKNYEALEEIFSKLQELSDQKIQLAEEAYELVDKYIIKLDKDTENFNIYAKRKIDATSPPIKEKKSGRKRTKSQSTSGRSASRSKKAGGNKSSEFTDSDMVPSTSKSGELYPNLLHGDMPIDPNEPTYCVCRQASFGQMVMCDNKNCSIEWFHFSCVGLATAPKGKWFCDCCVESRKKK